MQLIWGLVCALFACVNTASGLITIRFFLGLAEAGFLPGIIYWSKYQLYLHLVYVLNLFLVVGCWYPRSMQGRRFAILYSSVSLAGAFGGLLATAIHTLDGAHGIAGWR